MNYLKPLIERNLHVNVRIKKNNQTCVLEFYSKEVVDFLVKVGLKRGSKSKQVEIPKTFLSSTNFLKSFVEGFMDAEFCFTLKKRYKQFPYYPCIECNIASKKIWKQLIDIFKSFGLKPSSCVIKEYDKRFHKYWTKYRIDLNGVNNLIKFLKCFRPKNPKFIKFLSELSATLRKNKIKRKSYSKLLCISQRNSGGGI